MSEPKKTHLYNQHVALDAKMIEFSGWLMPVNYEGIIEEHEAVRENVGLFDVSHMGEVRIEGKEATAFLQYLFTNDLSLIENGHVQYGMMCYENGTVVDDLLIYKYHTESYLLVINAGNIEKDVAWITEKAADFDVRINPISDVLSEVALQGPNAEALLQSLSDEDIKEIGFFQFREDIHINGTPFLVSRTGYTGEDGFEIYGSHEAIKMLWDYLLEKGEPYHIKPCGLGARDTLRFEVALPLYGHEISDSISPLEAGLGFFVKLNKENFIGKAALEKQKEKGIAQKIVGFEMSKGIPRHGYEVFDGNEAIGYVTTGYYSPTLKKNIGLALINATFAKMGNTIEIQVRKKRMPATIISKKFYQKQYKK
jgi:aminomethyltransferase